MATRRVLAAVLIMLGVPFTMLVRPLNQAGAGRRMQNSLPAGSRRTCQLPPS